MRTSSRLGLLILYVSWGSTYPVMRVALRDVPPFLLLTVRCGFAGLVLYAIARAFGSAAPSRRAWLGSLATGALTLGVGHGLTTWAMRDVESGIAALLVSLVSAWMPLASWFLLGQRPARRVPMGLVLGVAGLALVVGTATRGLHAGVVLALIIAPIGWAFGSALSFRVALPAEPLMATATQLLAVTPLLGLTSLLTNEPARVTTGTTSASALTSVAYLSVVGYVIGFAVYTWLIREAPLSTVGTYAYVNPLVAVALGTAMLGERLTWQILTGGVVILTGVALVVLTPSPQLEDIDLVGDDSMFATEAT